VVVVAAAVLTMILAPSTAAQEQSAAGLRVHSSDIHDVTDADRGARPASVAIVGARNGAFSGKAVVVSSQPIQGLQATMGELKQATAAIPASCTTVRYGVPWDLTIGGWYRPKGRDILLEEPPAEVPPGRNGTAVVPVWVTVSVPADARPGTYTGRLTIEANGDRPMAVPVKLQVVGWTLPDTQDYRTWVELIQSPETLATEYNVPLWSDSHWDMIANSFRLIGQTGSRVVHVPLICHTNLGHSESMVRWIPRGENDYQYDFSIMETYLNLAHENMGKPKMVIFYAWDVYLKPPKEEVVIKEDDSSYVRMEKEKQAARWALRGKGPAVTVVDPDTGAVDTVYLPPYPDPSSKALWQPLWSELRARMARRGLEANMMLGVISDIWPTKEEVVFLDRVSSGLPWASCSHHARWLFGSRPASGGELYQTASIGYTAVALDHQYTLNPAKGRTYGWKKPEMHGQYWRFQFFNTSSHPKIRHEGECNITGNQRGLAHIGGDFWYAVKTKTGKRAGTVAGRFPQSYWHSLNIGGWLLGPGPSGPVGTTRLEVFREGIQECEARIFIESTLLDEALREKLGPELARRAQETLDERHRAMWRGRGAAEADFQHGLVEKYRDMYAMAKKWDAAAGTRWFLSSGWQERTAELYAVAGEVERKLTR
jgi:hypothetical protein